MFRNICAAKWQNSVIIIQSVHLPSDDCWDGCHSHLAKFKQLTSSTCSLLSECLCRFLPSSARLALVHWSTEIFFMMTKCLLQFLSDVPKMTILTHTILIPYTHDFNGQQGIGHGFMSLLLSVTSQCVRTAKQCHMIRDSSFLMPKSLLKFQWDHP